MVYLVVRVEKVEIEFLSNFGTFKWVLKKFIVGTIEMK
jgi:hypothetical protein